MENKDKVKHTLFIDTWSSRCGNCGKETLPDNKTHEKVSGYGGGEKGCGIEWKYLSSNYSGMGEDFYKRLKEMRPDLEFIPPFSLTFNN